jgi:spore cortex formation protein SpoVR/YcgB (stage V sporulation)
MNYGVDRYKRPYPISAAKERAQQQERAEYLQRQVNDLWRTIPKMASEEIEDIASRFPSEPQENLLYFIEKNAPLLEPWQREIVRIVRKIAQYFYPQKQTQVMNEGWACFWHYTLLNDLYDKGLVTEGFMVEFIQSHANVIYQPPYDSPHYSGINPYTLGFKMMMDIRRICEHPTEEDRAWFPEIADTDWLPALKFAMENFKDESFILQYLSPAIMREMKLFCVRDDDEEKDIEVKAIHDEAGYQTLRESLAGLYNLGNREPNLQIVDVDIRGERSLTLHHTQYQRRPLDNDSCEETLKHLHRLWGFEVRLESRDGEEIKQVFQCPEKIEDEE